MLLWRAITTGLGRSYWLWSCLMPPSSGRTVSPRRPSATGPNCKDIDWTDNKSSKFLPFRGLLLKPCFPAIAKTQNCTTNLATCFLLQVETWSHSWSKALFLCFSIQFLFNLIICLRTSSPLVVSPELDSSHKIRGTIFYPEIQKQERRRRTKREIGQERRLRYGLHKNNYKRHRERVQSSPF